MEYRVSKKEGILLLVIVMTNQLLLNIPNNFLKSTSTGLFLNTIYITIIAVVFALLIAKLFKSFATKDILDVSEYLGGKVLRVIIGIAYITFFVIISTTLVRYMAHSLTVIYFSSTPIAFILLLFLVPAAYINCLGLKAIARMNILIILAALFTMIIIGISLFQDLDFNYLFPILGYGINETFLIGISNIAVFSLFGFLYFLPPLLREPNDFRKISIISVAISGAYLIFTSTLLLVVFPYITHSNELMSGFLLARLVEYGEFIQRIDALFIFIWILATLSYISITLFFILSIFKKLTGIKRQSVIAPSIAILILGLALAIQRSSNLEFIEQYIYKYFALILIFGFSFLILLLATLKQRRNS
ncbi:MAG: spore germination protein [Oscillospiraceae bacterium]|nr:spore germination protein [Oscillospiraceae bacterium]